jgi:hypothetical protein
MIKIADRWRQCPQAVVGFILGETYQGGETCPNQAQCQYCGKQDRRGPSDPHRPAWCAAGGGQV